MLGDNHVRNTHSPGFLFGLPCPVCLLAHLAASKSFVLHCTSSPLSSTAIRIMAPLACAWSTYRALAGGERCLATEWPQRLPISPQFVFIARSRAFRYTTVYRTGTSSCSLDCNVALHLRLHRFDSFLLLIHEALLLRSSVLRGFSCTSWILKEILLLRPP